MTGEALPYRSVFVTGAGGYIGRLLVERLAAEPGALERIVASDLRVPEPAKRLLGVSYEVADIRTADLADAFQRHRTDVCVSVLAPRLRAALLQAPVELRHS